MHVGVYCDIKKGIRHLKVLDENKTCDKWLDLKGKTHPLNHTQQCTKNTMQLIQHKYCKVPNEVGQFVPPLQSEKSSPHADVIRQHSLPDCDNIIMITTIKMSFIHYSVGKHQGLEENSYRELFPK